VFHVGLEQIGCGVEEVHCAVDAYSHINAKLGGQPYHIVHVVEVVPRRQAEHERYSYFVF
jgi:hypothetical protein